MYCTPKAVQEQILKRKLLTASGCAVTLNKDRPDAATRRPAFPDVLGRPPPAAARLRGASSLLALETASRALLELLRSPARHKQQEALWCGSCAPRGLGEGPALCSLGDHERRLGLPAARARAEALQSVLHEEGRRGGYRERRSCARRGRARGTGLYRCASETPRESPAGMTKPTSWWQP